MRTSAKSKSSKQSSRRLNRPFAATILQRAREIAARYQVIVRQEDGEFFGRGLELPLTMDDGASADECVAKTREALVATVAYMLEIGETPPPSAEEGARTEQINIRLTTEEKLLLEGSARRFGFNGVSDFVRSKALA